MTAEPKTSMSPKANTSQHHLSFSLKSAAGTLPVVSLSRSGHTSTCPTAHSQQNIILRLFIKSCIKRKREPADHNTLLYQELIATLGGNQYVPLHHWVISFPTASRSNRRSRFLNFQLLLQLVYITYTTSGAYIQKQYILKSQKCSFVSTLLRHKVQHLPPYHWSFCNAPPTNH